MECKGKSVKECYALAFPFNMSKPCDTKHFLSFLKATVPQSLPTQIYKNSLLPLFHLGGKKCPPTVFNTSKYGSISK